MEKQQERMLFAAINAEQGVMIAQHIQGNAGGQHGPSGEEQQVVERVQVLLPGREGGAGMHEQDDAVAVAAQGAGSKG